MQEASARPVRKRQARGERRIQQILHAAATVFAEKGYDATSTNAIATEAGISPGSLYQFFANKDEIARALSEYYAGELTRLRAETFDPAGTADADLDGLVESTLASLLEFNLAHPGFKALFARTDMPASLREAVAPAQQVVHAGIVEILVPRFPGRSAEEVDLIATVAIQIVRGMTPLLLDAPDEATRAALAAQLRTAVLSYLRSA
ncbi:TetR/AcrR family transcriptional regulator [Nocardioides sp. NPDC057772]|uniref:TetR/AcrR family transcriptional regulator n=1 Tax=Nocardioides sp. NPDC057772 TaxID=3346245 RepID=UPI0036710185